MVLPSQAAHALPTARSPLSETANQGNARNTYSNTETVDLTEDSENQPQSNNAVDQPVKAGTKRKSTSNEDEPENDVHLSDIDVDGMPLEDNPDQIRRKIRRLLDNSDMKVVEFCRAIKVSDNAYRRFMSQSGRTKGLQSDVYMEASAYFKQRDIAGLKLPTAASKKAKTNSGDASSPKGRKNSSGGKGSSPDTAADLNQIELPGEATDNVPVYDTCADVRRKISAYLREPHHTQAQLCRDLHAMLHGPDKGNSLGASQMQRFRSKSGANEGGDSKVFYAGYVFFEKKRIAEKKKKSKKRLEMEKIWPNGVDRETFGRLM